MYVNQETLKQFEAAREQCVLCRLIDGNIPADPLFSNEQILLFKEIRPKVKGQLYITTHTHYPLLAYVPYEVTTQLFGCIPQIVEELRKQVACTGVDVLIVAGGIAGQTVGHVKIDVYPRDPSDGVYDFMIKPKVATEGRDMLANNLTIMLRNHARRNGIKPIISKKDIHGAIYQDNHCAVLCPEKGVTKGHLIIKSRVNNNVEEWSTEHAAHMLYVASFASTALFEGLGAQGTTILLRSGQSDRQGPCKIHVVARFPDDDCEITPLTGNKDNHLNKMSLTFKKERSVFDELASLI